MSMYICPECGNLIDESDLYIEVSRATWYDPPVYETEMCCGQDFVEAYTCDECGEFFKYEDLIDGELCVHCYKEKYGKEVDDL